jgi:alkylation response protein AidB-like acyl-CoA dehydrogenase
MGEESNGVHAMLQSQACGFMSRVLRGEGEVRAKDPERLISMLGDMTGAGYPGMLIPSDHGGEGGGLQEACIVVEEVAAGEPNLALMLVHHLACSFGLVLWAGEEQKSRFLPPLSSLERIGAVALTEPEAGSDLAAIKAGLERRGTELILNGNKCFVTNTGPGIDCFVLGFFREPSGLTCALVPSSSPGFHLAHHYRFAGWEGLPNHALVLQDCTVPREHLIADRLGGERFERWCDGARLLVSATATGMIRACMDEAVRYCGERRQHGKRLIEQQSLLFRIADISLSAALTRTSLRLAASRMDEGAPCHAEICMLKLFATSRLEEAASSAMEMAGGYGYTVDSVLSSLYRDAKGLQLLWGTREMLRLEIARSLGLREEAPCD